MITAHPPCQQASCRQPRCRYAKYWRPKSSLEGDWPGAMPIAPEAGAAALGFVPGTPHMPPCPPGMAKEQVFRHYLQMPDYYCTGYCSPKKPLMFI